MPDVLLPNHLLPSYQCKRALNCGCCFGKSGLGPADQQKMRRDSCLRAVTSESSWAALLFLGFATKAVKQRRAGLHRATRLSLPPGEMPVLLAGLGAY